MEREQILEMLEERNFKELKEVLENMKKLAEKCINVYAAQYLEQQSLSN